MVGNSIVCLTLVYQLNVFTEECMTMTHIEPTVVTLPDADSVSQAAAERIVSLITERVAASGVCTIALAGGSTPKDLYERLAQEPFRQQIPWEHVTVVWGDERYVPYDDPESSYRMAQEALLEHVPIPKDNIIPVPTHFPTPDRAARTYHVMIEHVFEIGGLDIVLLGMGDDGHTASLFPGHPALDAAADQFVVAVEDAPKPPPQRVSLTLSAINRAAHVIFLVTGEGKAAAVKTVLSPSQTPDQTATLPAQRVQPTNGQVWWFVDAKAGEMLSTDTSEI
jgi:6-phosphogluconolactonase